MSRREDGQGIEVDRRQGARRGRHRPPTDSGGVVSKAMDVLVQGGLTSGMDAGLRALSATAGLDGNLRTTTMRASR